MPSGIYERRPAKLVNPDDLYPAFRPSYLADLAKLTQPYAAACGMLLADAVVVGQGAVITRNALLLQESCRPILEQNRIPTGLRHVDSGWALPRPGQVKREDRISILAKAPWWRNYGHWLVDSAALLAMVVDRLRGNDIQIVVGRQTDPAMRRIVADTLDAVAPGIPVVEHDDADVMVFSRLYYITPTSVSPLFKLPAALRALREKLVPSAPSHRRRLYVQRDARGSRQLLNEPDVLRRAAAYGFEVVRPEEHDLRTQARIFSEAEFVIGVKGAALTNLVFSPRDSSVVVLSPSNWGDTFFWDLAGQLGINYVELMGRATDGMAEPPSSAFHIDVGKLDETLANVTGASAPIPAVASSPKPTPLAHAGLFYRDCLRDLHRVLQPRAYVQIGCLDGETLALAACPSIGIDVHFEPKVCVSPQAPAIMLFQMPSDDFFSRHDPAALLGRPIDLAFIDGMHLVENALRDFINLERSCHRDSMILLHDCLPLSRQMAVRDRAHANDARFPGWWTGDVWKLLAILPRYRPDLSVCVCDAPPTGLMAIRNLNPDDLSLDRAFDSIMAEFRDPVYEDQLFEEVMGRANVMETSAWLRDFGQPR